MATPRVRWHHASKSCVTAASAAMLRPPSVRSSRSRFARYSSVSGPGVTP